MTVDQDAIEPVPSDSELPVSVDKKEKKDKKKKDKKKNERGIETMFRTSLRNHIQLSAIADNKANIMLSVNAIIISFVVSFLFPNIKQDPSLLYPTAILLVVCITAVIFATISVIPNVTYGTFTRDDITNKAANLLFFGNFYNMPLKDFEWGIKEVMKDNDFLYSSMIRDFYNLGVVLSKKYKYLRICYQVFMYGMIIAVIAFILTFLFAKSGVN